MSNYTRSYERPQQRIVDIETILRLLQNKTGHCPRISGSSYVAGCPAHEDKHPSLSVTQRDDRILMYCFCGCSIHEVCDSLGIEVSDLFLKNKRGASYG